eukprot:7611073-Ditylum_brightwellii.AAC.1
MSILLMWNLGATLLFLVKMTMTIQKVLSEFASLDIRLVGGSAAYTSPTDLMAARYTEEQSMYTASSRWVHHTEMHQVQHSRVSN